MPAEITCPICHSSCGLAPESYSTREIFDCWEKLGAGYAFSRAVLEEYDPETVTRLHRCPNCEFGLFVPVVLGTDRFYRELSTMGEGWYYLPDKWEYRQSLSNLAGCGRILDIGCGKGFFLERCRERGIVAEGIELNSYAAEIARSNGFAVHEETLEEFKGNHREAFDAVCLFQVLEHVADPAELLRQALVCVKPGGFLVVGVPNMAGMMGKLEQAPTNIPPHHVSRWTPRTISALASSLGLEIGFIRFEPFQDHLALYMLQRYFSRMPASVRNSRVLARFLSVPPRVLRMILPNGVESLPGHTVLAGLRKSGGV